MTGNGVGKRQGRMLILALSGHASSVFDYFLSLLDNQEFTVFGIQSQWDNGGHTGILLKFYDYLREAYHEGPLSSGLLKIPPPMGDLKSQIIRFLENNCEGDEDKSKFLNLLSQKVNSDKLRVGLLRLLRAFTLVYPDFFSEADMNLANFFYEEYIKFAKNQGKESHSIGNLFLGFLYIYAQLHRERFEVMFDNPKDHQDIFFKLLKKLDFIPKGLRQEFLCEFAVTLSASDSKGTEIRGESYFDLDKIDNPDVIFGEANRLVLESYSFSASDDSNEETARQKFEKLLQEVGILVIPPGSLSNWMPLINKYSDLIKEHVEKLVWLPNSFCHVSEADIEAQYKYLFRLFGEKLHIVCPEHNVFENLGDRREEFVSAYEQQHKREANIEFLYGKANVFPLIDYEILEPGEGGIKYNQEVVSGVLGRIWMGEEIMEELRIEIQ